VTYPPSPAGTRLRTAAASAEFALRELIAIREILRAFITAGRPEEVYRFALERVGPLVGATFASVYVMDGASDLMRLAAAYNWPDRYAPWLGEMRVRLGVGPSGEAASSGETVEVPDVVADEEYADWVEIASELGFRAIVALPLQAGSRTLGAITFYFEEAGAFAAERRGLLRTVEDQIAATAEKASLIDELRRANAALVESNAELERQYAAAIEARRAKDEFLANISHELRTPLTAVLGYTQLMEEGVSGPLTPAQQRDLVQVRAASDRLLGLVNDLLELTTLKRGNLRVVAGEFDPREPLREAVDDVNATRKRAAGVALHVDLPDGPMPAMRSDRKKIVKILISLLSNAYKFTSAGEVRVSAEVRNGAVAYRVQDTGAGIAPQALPVVFDEFRQADGSYTRRYGGAGLGLALARRLARLLGGDIDVVSAPGTGSTFTVELPLECDVAAGEQGGGATAGQHSTRRA
jgi:signal transduction histidine kinase